MTTLEAVMHLLSQGKSLSLSTPQVMGILNVTPDSFSDGGCFITPEIAVPHALAMIEEGASIIDVGGESTRPHATLVTEAEELDRVIPIIEALRANTDVFISIDSGKATVMREALRAGANMINDVWALQQAGALEVASQYDVPICLMHMQGTPQTMQSDPHYQDLINDIKLFFRQRIQACVSAGIAKQRLVLDPGFGFGKTVDHNLQLIKQLDAFTTLGQAIMVGVSRKSTIGHVLGRTVDKRLFGSLALELMAARQGAQIIRTHEVRATVDALAMQDAVVRSAHPTSI